MDAFENLVAELLWRRGYWVQTSVRVELTKEEKKRVNRPNSTRCELDIVGYAAGSNELIVVECKSFLDSRGVSFSWFTKPTESKKDRFKLFSDPDLRTVIFNALRRQLEERSACAPGPKINLALACGRIPTEADRAQLKTHFAKHGWKFWDEEWLREELQGVAEGGYENRMSAVVAKLLLRRPEAAKVEQAG